MDFSAENLFEQNNLSKTGDQTLSSNILLY